MGNCAGGQNGPACGVAEADLPEGGVLAVVGMVLRRRAPVYEVEVGVGIQAGDVEGSRGGDTYDEDGDVVMSG